MSTFSLKSNISEDRSSPAGGGVIKRACEILEQVATNRCLTYRCLAKVFTYPDQELVDLLQDGELYLQIREITAWLGDEQKHLFQPLEALESLPKISMVDLQKDYACVFETGIERISPRESSYRWKATGAITESEADLRQVLNVLYNSVGVSCESGIEDHVAVELEFLAFLCEQEAQRWSNHSSETARNFRSQQRTFADDHIACWLPEFCYSLQKKNRYSLYGQVAILCDRWLDLDHGTGYRSLMGFE